MSLAYLFRKEKDRVLVEALVTQSDMSEENITRAAIRLYQSVTVRAQRGERMVFMDATGNLIHDGPGKERLGTGDSEAYPEGCTPEDACVLREANYKFAQENHQLRVALRFYANGDHAELPDWEGPTGDEQWLCPPLEIEIGEPFDRHGKRMAEFSPSWMVEDGHIARRALCGLELDWEGEEPKVIEGEPEDLIAKEAAREVFPARDGLREAALRLAQRVLQQWGGLYAEWSQHNGHMERLMDRRLPPADHIRALEDIAAALAQMPPVANRSEAD